MAAQSHQRSPERDIIQMLPVDSTSANPIFPSAIAQPLAPYVSRP
jgi:hypothetical protein